MTPKLKNNLTIQRLAADLSLRHSPDPVRAIVDYCHRKVRLFLRDYPSCPNTTELLKLVANKLGTIFVEVSTDADLARIKKDYVAKGDSAFVSLEQELSDDTFGVTLKRQQHNPKWEQPYVSIIDCRGTKRLKAYFTKWHEIGHLLILTDQTRLVFKRTHALHEPKSPEESLVDIIAGSFAYYPEMVRPLASGRISFEAVEAVRQTLSPDGSFHSALIGIANAWPSACILVEARMAPRKSDVDYRQDAFDFKTQPDTALRAVHISGNEAARTLGIKMFPHWRVPELSVISRVFQMREGTLEGNENLDWWETSGGKKLKSQRIAVSARWVGDAVYALIIPH
jgi:hypothetical protein